MSKKDYDVIIIGAGPTGIFTAMEFVKKEAELNILILEKGTDLDRRVCPMKENPDMGCVNCPSCAIVSGWGGLEPIVMENCLFLLILVEI